MQNVFYSLALTKIFMSLLLFIVVSIPASLRHSHLSSYRCAVAALFTRY